MASIYETLHLYLYLYLHLCAAGVECGASNGAASSYRCRDGVSCRYIWVTAATQWSCVECARIINLLKVIWHSNQMRHKKVARTVLFFFSLRAATVCTLRLCVSLLSSLPPSIPPHHHYHLSGSLSRLVSSRLVLLAMGKVNPFKRRIMIVLMMRRSPTYNSTHIHTHTEAHTHMNTLQSCEEQSSVIIDN